MQRLAPGREIALSGLLVHSRTGRAGVIFRTGENTVTMASLIQMSIDPARVAIMSGSHGAGKAPVVVLAA